MSTALTIVVLVSDTVVIEPVGTDTVIGTVSSVFSVALSRMACTREDSTTVLGLPRWALNATSSLHAELISEVPVENREIILWHERTERLYYGMKGQRDYIIIIDIIIIIISIISIIIIIIIIIIVISIIIIIIIFISIIIIIITLLLLLLSLLLSYYHYYFIVISTTFIRIEIKKIDTLILNNIL